jgi:hypothetical protein
VGKNLYIILGNGFSIDFIKYISKENHEIAQRIDLVNLFSQGSNLRWPQDNKPGFLSFKRCPNLWNIGARTNASQAETNEILERVVTCANVYSLRRGTSLAGGIGNGFLHAYKELVSYLKYLFIHYNSLVKDIPETARDWAWSKFFTSIQSDENIDSVCIVSYNYDIWLERLLHFLNIPFSLPLLHINDRAKVKIFKPHGSISFLHKNKLLPESFSINYSDLAVDCPLSEIRHELIDINHHTPVNFIIPPAGESGRANHTWAQAIRGECMGQANSCKDDDLAIVCGISYWHVDRGEIDILLNSMKSTMELLHINPYPSQTLDAVLNSLFSKYTHFTTSEVLSEYFV